MGTECGELHADSLGGDGGGGYSAGRGHGSRGRGQGGRGRGHGGCGRGHGGRGRGHGGRGRGHGGCGPGGAGCSCGGCGCNLSSNNITRAQSDKGPKQQKQTGFKDFHFIFEILLVILQTGVTVILFYSVYINHRWDLISTSFIRISYIVYESAYVFKLFSVCSKFCHLKKGSHGMDYLFQRYQVSLL